MKDEKDQNGAYTVELISIDGVVLDKYLQKICSKNNDSNYYKVHTVKKGDTLYSISKKYNTTIEAIKIANEMNDEKVIIGKALKIPTQ